MPDVTLGPSNTIAVLAASGVYRLRGVTPTTMTVNLLNIGPGSIYIRQPQDPAVAGADSRMVPANFFLNGLTIDGQAGLGIVADADTTISLGLI
jgi:hypothetical protein